MSKKNDVPALGGLADWIAKEMDPARHIEHPADQLIDAVTDSELAQAYLRWGRTWNNITGERIRAALAKAEAAARDPQYWDRWAAEVGAIIELGDHQAAGREVIKMARYALSVQISDYGARCVKNVLNAYWVAYLGG